MLTYKLDEIPFSVPGSYLIITSRRTNGSNRLLYKTCSRQAVTTRGMPFEADNFFEIALARDGVEIPYSWTAQPHRLDLLAEGGGLATLAFSDPDTIGFETQNVNLRLLSCKGFATEFWPGSDTYCAVDWPARGFHLLRAGKGTQLKITDAPAYSGPSHIFNEKPRGIDFIGKRGAIRFTHYESKWEDPLPLMLDVLWDRELEYARWTRFLPVMPERYLQAAEQAWFLLWNSQVDPYGPLTRPAIYMSKFWMNNIWAWDNCFNALAIAEADPDLAWNQLMLFFDHQDPNGMIPDSVNDLEAIYCFNKPPIYGWIIHKMVDKIGLKKSLPYLRRLYKPVSLLTDWWYNLRDFDGDGMPQYHHGNDSGLDNATAFDQGYPTEGADLAAHLVLQMEGLAFMADALGKRNSAKRWHKRAEKALARLLSKGTKDKHFFSPLDGKDEAPETQSLLNYLPMELGHRLPKDIRKSLVADLAPGGTFLTDYGLATEAINSPKYEPDGYWRGPIWAPSTYLIFDGLVDAGETQLARTIAERFCDMCVKDPGFWENYDALTGKGLRCPGYTWTASVFLLLAEWLANI